MYRMASPDQSAGACILIIFGFLIAFMGVLFYFMFGEIIPPFVSFFLLLIAVGFILFIIGAVKAPNARRETAKWQSIIEIAAVRKEVSISDISYETRLDNEYVRNVLTQCLVGGYLFGYIENDLFVRDTSGRRYSTFRKSPDVFSIDDE